MSQSHSRQSSTLLARQRLAFDMIDRGDPTPDVLAVLCHIVEAEALSSVRAAILLMDAAGHCPICGSTGPSTADGDITMRSAASAMSVPPLIA